MLVHVFMLEKSVYYVQCVVTVELQQESSVIINVSINISANRTLVNSLVLTLHRASLIPPTISDTVHLRSLGSIPVFNTGTVKHLQPQHAQPSSEGRHSSTQLAGWGLTRIPTLAWYAVCLINFTDFTVVVAQVIRFDKIGHSIHTETFPTSAGTTGRRCCGHICVRERPCIESTASVVVRQSLHLKRRHCHLP